MESWQRRDFQQGIEILERASRLDPANAGILLDLGRFYGKRYDYAAAERCFEKAVRNILKWQAEYPISVRFVMIIRYDYIGNKSILLERKQLLEVKK